MGQENLGYLLGQVFEESGGVRGQEVVYSARNFRVIDGPVQVV